MTEKDMNLQFAQYGKITPDGLIDVGAGDFPLQMKNSDGTGIDLVEENGLGAGVIRFAPGKGVQSHIHEGDHILKVEKGHGWLTYDKEKHRMHPGFVYFVKGNVPHAIHAETELTLFVVGNNYRPMDSEERMTPI